MYEMYEPKVTHESARPMDQYGILSRHVDIKYMSKVPPRMRDLEQVRQSLVAAATATGEMSVVERVGRGHELARRLMNRWELAGDLSHRLGNDESTRIARWAMQDAAQLESDYLGSCHLSRDVADSLFRHIPAATLIDAAVGRGCGGRPHLLDAAAQAVAVERHGQTSDQPHAAHARLIIEEAERIGHMSPDIERIRWLAARN